jgi:hypothetical protein
MRRVAIALFLVLLASQAFASEYEFTFSGDISSYADKLPLDYKGDDIVKLYEKLSSAEIKGEFEKTEDYKKRISTLDNNIYGFIVQKRNISSVMLKEYITYDADKELFHLEPDIVRSYKYNKDEIYDHVGLVSTEIVKEERTGPYNYVPIPKIYSNIYEIDADNVEYINGNHSCCSIDITEGPEEAKKIKGDLSLLIIAMPLVGEKLTSHGHFKAETSMKYHFELINDVNGISMKVLELWVYNQKTGQVLAKKIIDTP